MTITYTFDSESAYSKALQIMISSEYRYYRNDTQRQICAELYGFTKHRIHSLSVNQKEVH